MTQFYFIYAIVSVPLSIILIKSKSLLARLLVFLALSLCTFLLTSFLVFDARTDANIMQGSPAYFAIGQTIQRLSENDPTLLNDLRTLRDKLDPKNFKGQNGKILAEFANNSQDGSQD